MRRLWADVILVLLVMCLAGCKRWDTEYQEINIAETEAVSDREEADSSYQDKFAKGYDFNQLETRYGRP